MVLTNNIRKTVASLGEAKHRKALGLFKAEGTKCVLDTIGHFSLRYLLATNAWIERYHDVVAAVGGDDAVCPVAKSDLERMSSLSTAPQVIAVYEIPQSEWSEESVGSNELIVALDCVQDPGNLGTIMRTADWFGVRTIVCSPDTVDVYSPKVVQATMGAISRVKVHYRDLVQTLTDLGRLPIYGTFLDGDDMYREPLSAGGVVVMGNEGKGVSAPVAKLVNRRLYIPPYPADAATSESLNVATATAVVLSEFRRRL